MLELLAAEAGFLVDAKIKEALKQMTPEEADIAQAESMLRALGISGEAELQSLLTYFIKEVSTSYKGKIQPRECLIFCLPAIMSCRFQWQKKTRRKIRIPLQ